MSGATAEALWVGDGIRVRADGVLEDWAGFGSGWVKYRPTVVGSGDVQALAHAFAIVAKQVAAFRQALPENECGPGWEQAVLTAIDTRREVLAAVDEHVPGWDPARPVAEVVGYLAEDALESETSELEEGLSVANDEIAGLEVERDALRSCVDRALTLLRSVASGLQPFATQQQRTLHLASGVLHAAHSAPVVDLIEVVRQFATAEPVSPAYEFAPTAERLTKADAADAVFAIRPVLVTDKYTEGIAVACEEFAHRLGLDVGHGPPNAAGYGEARLQAHLARYRPTEPTSAVYAMGPDTVWTNGRIRVHRSGTVQIGPHWDAIQDGDLQALGAAMVRMRADMLTADPYVSRVTEFHRAMGLPVRLVPSVGTADERILRVRMLLEEVLEFAKASAIRVTVHVGHGGVLHGASDLEFEPHDADEPDLVAMTHELGDCQVIVSGCAVQLGLPILPAVREEIHPANMRKLGPDGRPIVRADGKVVKPEGWKPANVACVVERALAAGEVSHG